MKKLILALAFICASSVEAGVIVEVFAGGYCAKPVFTIELTGNVELDTRVCNFAMANREFSIYSGLNGSLRLKDGKCGPTGFTLKDVCSMLADAMLKGTRVWENPGPD